MNNKAEQEIKTSEELKKGLARPGNTQLFRHVSGWIGAGFYLTGVFLSQNGIWKESNPTELFKEFETTSIKYESQLYLEKDKVLTKSNKKGEGGSTDIIAGYITLDTAGTVNILESNNCSSATDNGTDDYSINFLEPLGDYIYSFIPSEPVKILKAYPENGSLRIILEKNFSGIIKVLFFKQILTYN
jgi:hypothetical protein